MYLNKAVYMYTKQKISNNWHVWHSNYFFYFDLNIKQIKASCMYISSHIITYRTYINQLQYRFFKPESFHVIINVIMIQRSISFSCRKISRKVKICLNLVVTIILFSPKYSEIKLVFLRGYFGQFTYNRKITSKNLKECIWHNK